VGGGLRVRAAIRQGAAADEILHHVRAEGADLIVMCTSSRSGEARTVLGSVVARVLGQSPVPVALLRPGGRAITHISRLLVPVDGSPCGAVALGAAVGLARAAGATVRLIEVVVPIPDDVYRAWPINGAAYVWDEQALARARVYVDGLVARLLASGLMSEGDTRFGGSVSDTIVEVAEEVEADLIVMSTRALVGPSRALLGSVAGAVVSAARCPVLLLPWSNEIHP
jgi:nucleotide-binding universal stress UspA family protein